MIPRKIHQVWIQDDELPEKLWECRRSWWRYQDRGWEYQMWHGGEIRELLESHFPHLVPCYDNARSHSSRSNFARYIILYLYGGVYVDTDMKSVRDIDRLMDGHEFVVCRETPHQLATCIIASIPFHPILSRCLAYYKDHLYDPYQMSYLASGPVFFSKRFGEHIRANRVSGDAINPNADENVERDEEAPGDGIVVYDTHIFLPVSFTGRVDMDPDVSDPSLNGAYTIHYWDYSWKKSASASTINVWIIILLAILVACFIAWGILQTRKSKKCVY